MLFIFYPDRRACKDNTLNVTSAVQTVTVTNTGAAPLSINGINLGGTNANQFNRNNGCGGTLGAGASCTVTVTFRPTSANPLTKSATLTVSVAAPAASQAVTLTGAVLAPAYTVTPASLAFGTQAVNTNSANQSVTVSNAGPGALGINGIAIGGANASQFSIRSNNCPGNLAANASCTVAVRFRPTSAGAKAASLNVNVAAPATSQSASLTGTGQ